MRCHQTRFSNTQIYICYHLTTSLNPLSWVSSSFIFAHNSKSWNLPDLGITSRFICVVMCSRELFWQDHRRLRHKWHVLIRSSVSLGCPHNQPPHRDMSWCDWNRTDGSCWQCLQAFNCWQCHHQPKPSIARLVINFTQQSSIRQPEAKHTLCLYTSNWDQGRYSFIHVHLNEFCKENT